MCKFAGVFHCDPAWLLVMQIRIGFAGWLCVTGLLGCGGRPTIKTAPIAGKVTYNGKSLTHGQVILMHPSGEVGSGKIGLDGTYRLEAPVGECKVKILCFDQPDLSKLKPPSDDAKGGVPRTIIPHRYSNFETSGFKVTLVDGDNTHDWNLLD